MAKRERLPLWECDRCKALVESEKPPNKNNNAWGTLMINQDAGWDHHGAPWAPRMREPLHLCGPCIEEIVQFINSPTDPQPQP